jgi:hypothetical protein
VPSRRQRQIQLRQDLCNLHLSYLTYEIAKRNYELNARLKDQSFEQIKAPPAGGTQTLAQTASAATQTTNLVNFQRGTTIGFLSRHRCLALRRLGGLQ